MKTRLTKLLITLLVLLMATPIIYVGCQEDKKQPSAPSPTGLSSTLVPNMNLDAYIYVKQDNPTKIPAKITGIPADIEVESLALWGVPADAELALGAGLTLTSASGASELYAKIDLGKDVWKMLSGNTIYLVQGSGTAAESLKTAISNRDFKHYDDKEALEAVAALPSHSTAKLAAIAIAKPSKALIGFIAKDVNPEGLGQINMILNLAKLKVIAAGLYSPNQIDIAKVMGTMESSSNISDLNLGLLILVESSLPGLLVEPAVKKILTESAFTETKLGELMLYKRSLDINRSKAIPVLVRINGNRIFAAVAGQESYAETLITSVNK